MSCCPICGRRNARARLRRDPSALAPLPLFEWVPPVRVTSPPVHARLMLLHGCRDSDGQPRPALMIPGQRSPTVFPNIAAALAAKIAMEAAR